MGVLAALDVIENHFIFPAPTPSYGPQSYKRHLCWIPWNPVISPQRANDPSCSDGIPCLWFAAPRAATVIIFFHANAEDLGMSFGLLKHMRDQFKVNVLAVEYPGYGLLNHLKASEEAVCEVALTAFRFLFDEIKVPYSQLVLFGRSLGSGPAVHLASQYPVGGLILVSAFSSIRGAAQSIAGRFVAWTCKEHFPNLQLISNVSSPTLIIHGENDGLMPVEHSLRLFKRCRARKLMSTPPNMDHNSNLFADASFLAVPAIHFFGFPGFCTSTPPRLPTHLFEKCERRGPIVPPDDHCARSGLCGCLAKKDPHQLDIPYGSPELANGTDRADYYAKDITIRFNDAPNLNEKKHGTDSLEVEPPCAGPDLEINWDDVMPSEELSEKVDKELSGDSQKENNNKLQKQKDGRATDSLLAKPDKVALGSLAPPLPPEAAMVM